MGRKRDGGRCGIPIGHNQVCGSASLSHHPVQPRFDQPEGPERQHRPTLQGGKRSAADSAEATPVSSFHPDPKHLAACVGIYADAKENYVLRLEQRGDALWAESFTGPDAIGPAPIEAIGQDRFRGLSLGLKELDFTKDHRALTAQRPDMPSVYY